MNIKAIYIPVVTTLPVGVEPVGAGSEPSQSGTTADTRALGGNLNVLPHIALNPVLILIVVGELKPKVVWSAKISIGFSPKSSVSTIATKSSHHHMASRYEHFHVRDARDFNSSPVSPPLGSDLGHDVLGVCGPRRNIGDNLQLFVGPLGRVLDPAVSPEATSIPRPSVAPYMLSCELA